MTDQPRVAKVLVVLLISMTTGAVVLMAVNGKPPSAGPFCLSTYYRLDPVEEAILSEATQNASRWNCIEIYFSGTKAGNIEQLSSLAGHTSPEQIDCHFVVCNGLGGADGEILKTKKWQRQWSIVPGRNWYGTPQTIRICVVADGNPDVSGFASNSQVRRVEALVEKLSRRFRIDYNAVFYPGNWR
ncbi:MAG: hypothetical protein JW804_02510 [Sedimentisphaerales bacterium]|nr:hypothetical protein [Sedimentisphaerales bacterium]